MGKIKQMRINAKEKVLFALPPIDHYSSRKEWEDACWQKISKSGDFLEILVTSYERHGLVMRAAVIESVKLGKRYRQIADELWLSPQTISSIKKAINESGYRSYRERSKTERKKKTYSPDFTSTRKKRHGKPIRTKFGTVYLP